MKLKVLAFTIYILISVLHVFAQNIQNIGVPYVENFFKSSYQAGNQNWAIAKDNNGIVYFGNADGLLSFDGKFWQTHEVPNDLIVRSVATDDKGRIYTGSFGEFGYWEYNQEGILKYHSLKNLVKDKTTLNNEIWKIYVDGDRVIFQSFANIYIYQNNKIELLEGKGSFLFLLKVGNRFFVEVSNNGLYELKGKKLFQLPNNNGSEVNGVHSVMPFGDNKFIIGTAKNGLFIYDGLNFTAWNNEASDFLKTYQLNNGVKVFGKYYAYGTILNGIIIVNQNGNILQHINKSSGLQNNTALSLYADSLENLWVGLDNGIDRVELNSPLYFFFDKNGEFGTVYSSIIYNGNIYLGTNQGLYYSSWNTAKNNRQSFNFKFIPNSQGQVWDLSVFDNQLFCGHNNGTYLVKDGVIQKIADISGGWTMKQMKLYPDKLIQGTYTGLIIYNKTANGYAFSHKVAGFREPSRYVEQDDKGNIWVSHPYKGVYKINLTEDLLTAKRVKAYDETAGLPTTYQTNTFNLDGEIIFSSSKGFYVYNDISDLFTPYGELNSKLKSFASSNKVIKADDKRYWFIDHGKVALANFKQPGKFNIDSSMFNVLNGRMVQDYENISKINDNLFLISVDDGFVIYNKQSLTQKPKVLPKLIIGKVENIASNNYLITENPSFSKQISVKYAQNSIRISYSLPFYRQGKIKYQYLLDGYSNNWSSWSNATQKDFTNLPYGNYTFKVRAVVNDGSISEISSFSFEVLPPFYATFWAMLFYFLLLIIAVYYIRVWYFKKLSKHEAEIQLKLQKERDEHLKEEALINEQKLIKLKTEKLQAEIDSKGREVTNSAMNIVYKNELLQKIKDDIANLKDAQGKKLGDEQLKRLQKIIDEGMNDERDWNLFETSFNETHENFFKKLKAEHPDLVPNDLKLCAYLRMNMSSKEMASLLNISVRGVEIRRYRLRKKLNLSHDKNLNEFLIEL